MTKRSELETEIQRQIEADLGAEFDFLLLRNSIGMATYFDDKNLKEWKVPYGLGSGSPDLVGILRVRVRPNRTTSIAMRALGVWLCMEVKVPGEEATAEQKKVHEQWRRFGALVFTVHSVAEARAALAEAREAA